MSYGIDMAQHGKLFVLEGSVSAFTPLSVKRVVTYVQGSTNVCNGVWSNIHNSL